MFVFVVPLLASCQPFRDISGPVSDEEHVDVVEISGRIAFITPSRSGSAQFRWKSEKSAYELQLTGRFGIGRIVIRGTKESADIETSSGETMENIDLQAWLIDTFEIDVPILDLPACMRMDCEFAKNGTSRQYDRNGRLQEFENQGWSVKSTYTKNQLGELVVKEMRLQRDETRFRIVFDG